MPAPKPTAPYDALTAAARDLLFRTAAYLGDEEQALLEKACAYAFHAHDGQTRKSGEPYITHPLAVATQLAIWHMDIQGLCAGVMHDVLEDTGVTKLEMTAEFGDTIAEMVDGLSKLEKLEYDSQAEHQAESFRKLILAMTKDIRVIVIKLSDRLHNMRTLGSMRPEKRRRIAQETLEIYAQIANRIGLNNAYQELQDLSFQNLHPRRYETLQKAMKASRRNRRDVVGKVLRAFSQRLVSANIEAKIKGREKNLYSIHQKMQAKNLRFAEVMDIYGFRVIVNSIPACYSALGALHSLYQPKPGRIKDYIAIPKSNGYQSLHTTLVGPYGLPIEVQIRTREMDAVAEGGVAGHWIYKSGENTVDQATLRTNQWLQNILDLQARSANAMEFLEHVKVDLFPDEVYILTPKGKILVLPDGATPIDFAYAVHTDIGNRTVAARINNTMMPQNVLLSDGLKEKYLADLNNKQTTFEDILYSVGMGHTLPVSVAMHIAELAGEHFGDEVKLSPIKINGNETGRVHLAQCCNPIPGDSIRAVIIKDQGMIIHRDTCPNVLKADPEQQLDADWDSIHDRSYRTHLTVGARDAHGLLAAMAQAISGTNADIESVETPSQKQAGTEGFIEFKFFIKTQNLDQLNEIIRALHAIPQVRRVVRN